jgi:hypothetical protein
VTLREDRPGGAPAEGLEAQSAGAGDGTAPATNTAALPAPPAAAPAATHPPAPRGEGQRVLWFVMGALSTGFGVWLGRALFS